MALSQEVGSFAKGTTGNNTVNLNGAFTPSRIHLWVGPRSATTETSNLSSFGYIDVGQSISVCQSNFSGSIGHQTISSTSKCLLHYANVAGVITKVLDLTYVSVAAGAFTVNFGTANANYSIFFEALA